MESLNITFEIVSTDKITLEIFTRKLVLLMADHDVTQEALANAVGVAQSAVSKLYPWNPTASD
jgi:hypothetical protein